MLGIARLTGVLATLSLGLTAGALLTEALVLVPLWRSMAPETFLEWYRANATLLFQFFAPLEITTTVVVVLAAAVGFARRGSDRGLWVLATLLCVLVLLAFPIYFKDVNASFEQGTIDVSQLGAELRRWSAWHWARTVAAIMAFVTACFALMKHSS